MAESAICDTYLLKIGRRYYRADLVSKERLSAVSRANQAATSASFFLKSFPHLKL
ncbi:Sel1 [Roseibium sp. TrichSKD4]|nr:Sel1 [Roseibium sp. TrichSKD4]